MVDFQNYANLKKYCNIEIILIDILKYTILSKDDRVVFEYSIFSVLLYDLDFLGDKDFISNKHFLNENGHGFLRWMIENEFKTVMGL